MRAVSAWTAMLIPMLEYSLIPFPHAPCRLQPQRRTNAPHMAKALDGMMLTDGMDAFLKLGVHGGENGETAAHASIPD